VLGDVTETIYEPNDPEDSDDESERRTMEKKSEMLFVRGDSVVMIAAVK
jgi:U6 snRNA-associated Sm-like protein LSm3